MAEERRAVAEVAEVAEVAGRAAKGLPALEVSHAAAIAWSSSDASESESPPEADACAGGGCTSASCSARAVGGVGGGSATPRTGLARAGLDASARGSARQLCCDCCGRRRCKRRCSAARWAAVWAMLPVRVTLYKPSALLSSSSTCVGVRACLSAGKAGHCAESEQHRENTRGVKYGGHG